MNRPVTSVSRFSDKGQFRSGPDEDAWRVIEWYECRWVVEEYHKALKTGCNIEYLQFCDESHG